MEGPQRNVIVNEADDRKLGVYTEGDTDATIDGIAVLGEQATNTLQPLSIDKSGTLRVSSTIVGQDAGTTLQVKVEAGAGTFAVYFSPARPTVISDAGTGTFRVGDIPGTTAVYFSPSQPTIKGITDSINVYLGGTGGTIAADVGKVAGTIAVFFSPSNPAVNIGSGSINVYLGATAGTIAANVGKVDGTVAVFFSPANPAVAATFSGTVGVNLGKVDGTIQVSVGKIDDSVAIKSGTLTGITNSINVYLGGTAGTIATNIGTIAGTAAVFFSPSRPTVIADAGTGTFQAKVEAGAGTMAVYFSPSVPAIRDITSTGVIPVTASGSTSTAGGSGSNTVVSPEAGRNIKVYAYALTTTGIVSISPRFTTGGSAGATELWRIALQAPSAVSAGANLAVQPPGYLFATGTGNTLALYLDSATLVHYSVAYFKESS